MKQYSVTYFFLSVFVGFFVIVLLNNFFGDWLSQPITELKIWHLLLMFLLVYSMFFLVYSKMRGD